jgi:hypothetical protein
MCQIKIENRRNISKNVANNNQLTTYNKRSILFSIIFLHMKVLLKVNNRFDSIKLIFGLFEEESLSLLFSYLP